MARAGLFAGVLCLLFALGAAIGQKSEPLSVVPTPAQTESVAFIEGSKRVDPPVQAHNADATIQALQHRVHKLQETTAHETAAVLGGVTPEHLTEQTRKKAEQIIADAELQANELVHAAHADAVMHVRERHHHHHGEGPSVRVSVKSPTSVEASAHGSEHHEHGHHEHHPHHSEHGHSEHGHHPSHGHHGHHDPSSAAAHADVSVTTDPHTRHESASVAAAANEPLPGHASSHHGAHHTSHPAHSAHSAHGHYGSPASPPHPHHVSGHDAHTPTVAADGHHVVPSTLSTVHMAGDHHSAKLYESIHTDDNMLTDVKQLRAAAEHVKQAEHALHATKEHVQQICKSPTCEAHR